MNQLAHYLAFAGIFIVTYSAFMFGYALIVRVFTGRWPL